MITMILADDHTMFVDCLRARLSPEEDFHILATASNGIQLLDLVQQHQPRLIITDVNMPEMNGLKTISKIRQEHPRTLIIALTAYCSRGTLMPLLSLGVQGIVTKDNAAGELIKAIRRVVDGKKYHSRQVT